MVVKTRSKHTSEENIQDVDIDINVIGDDSGSRRRVKIVTPSLVQASTRTYKIYSPVNKPEMSKKKKCVRQRRNCANYASTMVDEAAEVVDAAEALVSLFQYDDYSDVSQTSSPAQSPSTSGANSRCISHTCMNPMQPVTKYVYRIGIYNINQTLHYKSAYVLYDQKNRLFYVYTIISNQVPCEEGNAADAAAPTGLSSDTMIMTFSLPEPNNTIQTKYTTYISDTVSNYITTMIIPSNDFDYFIQDDILGYAVSTEEFREKAFSDESSYYDIEHIIYDNTSSETTTGQKAFKLIPSRNFWYSPVGGYYAVSDANTVAYSDHKYTPDILTSVLMILSQSS